MNHFIDLLDWNAEQILKLLKDAAHMKKAAIKGKHRPHLQGRVLGMIFEKPSLRTRVSFQAGIAQLGGQAIFLNGSEVGLGNRESLPDIARTVDGKIGAGDTITGSVRVLDLNLVELTLTNRTRHWTFARQIRSGS